MEFTGRPERPTGVRRMLYRLPVWLYRARLGVLLGTRFVLINHVGRKTGRWRQVVVEVVDRDPATGAVTVASGFGPDADWYRNLLAHPQATIQLGSRSATVRAVPLSEDGAAEAMARYARRHPRAARGLSALMGFRVDGSKADYLEAGRRIPMLRLEPLGNVGA
ncbi:MAG: nitroreductase family deazaflavin-dependent oxidoreductase [bacterium]